MRYERLRASYLPLIRKRNLDGSNTLDGQCVCPVTPQDPNLFGSTRRCFAGGPEQAHRIFASAVALVATTLRGGTQ